MYTRIQDLRFALRQLLRRPGFAVVAVMTLALGIGVNIAIFSIVNGAILQPLPYDNGDELVLIRQGSPLGQMPNLGVSVQEMEDYRDKNQTLAGVVEYHSLWFTLFDQGIPERVQSGVVSANFFQVLGVRPLYGRLFTPDEDVRGAEPVLLLGYDFWQTHFGGDPEVLGGTVELNDHLHTIVGILPPLPAYPGANDVWMPWHACPFRTGGNWLLDREWRSLSIFGLLGRGVGIDRAQADVAGITRQMRAEHPESYEEHPDLTVTLDPLREELTRQARPLFLLLLGISGFVLLIACANVANLTLARMSRREHELSVCSALGATRGRLSRQILVEAALLALIGGALGLLLASRMVDLFSAFAVRFTPRGSEVDIDGWVVIFAAAASLVAGLVTGGISSLVFVRKSESSIRKESRHVTPGGAAKRARGALVAFQIAITFVLLVGGGLALRSFVKLQRVDPGFNPENVLTMHLDLDWSTYMNVDARRSFYRDLLERIAALPETVSASLAGSIPLDGGVPSGPVQIEGRAVAETGTAGVQTNYQVASQGYFETLGIPLLQGRTFEASDHADAPAVVIISQSMALRHWDGGNPIGSRISDDGENWATIVGVVGDVKQEGLESEFRDQAYVPLAQNSPLNANLLIRTVGDPGSLSRAATETVHAVDVRQPVAFVRTLREIRDESVASPKLTALLLGFFGALALAISVAGVAGLVAFTASQRIPEIGVRMALGANRWDVLWTVVRQSVRLIVFGLAVGTIGALGLARLIASWLYDVPPTDPLTFVGVALVLLSAALVSAMLPALRATRVDPVIALKAE